MRWETKLPAVIAAGALSVLPAFSATHYVATNGVDSGNCTNLASPCATVQYALDQAADGDEISIGPGTFTEAGITVSSNVTVRGQGQTVSIVQAAADTPSAVDRIFTVNAGVNSRFEDLTLRHGNSTGGSGILNYGTTTVVRCTIRDGLVSSPGSGGAIYCGPYASLRVESSSLLNNTARSGGAIGAGANEAVVALFDSVVSSNTATTSSGGGVYAWSGGSVTLSNCVFRANTSWQYGGAVYGNDAVVLRSSFTSNSADYGGGAYFSGHARVERSLFAFNEAFVDGGGLLASCLHIINSTVHGNQAGSSGNGGGFWAGVHITEHCTVTDNTAGKYGGGIYENTSRWPLLSHSIVYGNTAGSFGHDLWRYFESMGHNIIGNTSNITIYGDSTGNLYWTDPQLGSLQDNGGPTLTREPLPGSPAIDAGRIGISDAPSVDQEGEPRVYNGRIDIGAVESPPSNGDLGVTKAFFPLHPQEGDTVEFNVSVHNYGLTNVNGIVASDLLPAGLTYVAHTGVGYDPTSGVWTVGALAGLSSEIVVIEAVLDGGTGHTVITNTVAITAAGTPDGAPGNNTVSVRVPVAMDLYVAPGGSDSGNACTNPASPCATLAHAISQSVAGDTIHLAAGTYTEYGVGVDRELTIRGAGSATTILQGHASPGAAPWRILEIGTNVTAVVEDLTVRHGRSPAASVDTLGGMGGADGGGVHNVGYLTMRRCRVVDNTCGASDTGYDGGRGGGVYNDLVLLLEECEVRGNVAWRGRDGGGVFNGRDAVCTIFDSSIVSNKAGSSADWAGDRGGRGGGIFTYFATLSMSNTLVHANSAGFADRFNPDDGGDGGGIWARGLLRIENSTISSNRTGFAYFGSGSGGGLYIDGGTDTDCEKALPALRRFRYEISGSTISGNRSGNADTNYWDALAGGQGGGIRAGGELTMVHCTVSGNRAGDGNLGGAGGAGGDGGGIYAANDVDLHHCTVVRNSAGAAGGSGAQGQGGGVYNQYSAASIVASHTIFGNNTVEPGGSGPDFSGALTSEGHNLVESTAGTTVSGDTAGNVTGQDPLLGPLADNGGLTHTHELLPGSPAINAGDTTLLPPPYFDQRGGARFQGAAIDIGAYEVPAWSDLVVTKTASDTLLAEGDSVTFTVVVSNIGPDNASSVLVLDPLPAGLGYIESSSAAYNPASGDWSVGPLDAGASTGLTITAMAESGTARMVLTNVATAVSGVETDPVSSNNSAQAIVYVRGPNTLYVGPAGSDGNNCTNPATPCATIQHAIDMAFLHGDTIQVAAGTYTEAGITVDKHVRIVGADSAATIVQAAATPNTASDRVFHVAPGYTVEIEGLTVRHGRTGTHAGPSDYSGEDGGGILNEGNLVLRSCEILDNRAGNGSDTSMDVDDDYTGGHGGGIFSATNSVLVMEECRLERNSTGRGGDVAINVQGLGDYSLDAYGGGGGGVYALGADLTMLNCTVASNFTRRGGHNADEDYSKAGGGRGGSGGGIFAAYSTTIISNVTVIRNTCGPGGNYTGGGHTHGLDNARSGGPCGGIWAHGDTLLVDSIVSSNTAGTGGTTSRPGGRGGYGGWAGGIGQGGRLHVLRCTISGNNAGAGGDGGGYGGRGGDAGGILVLEVEETGELVVESSTISDNRAGAGGAGTTYGGLGGDGGAIFSDHRMYVTNSTVSGNRAGNAGAGGSIDGGNGGGIYSSGSGRIAHSTVADNTTGSKNGAGKGGDGGGLYQDTNQVLFVTHTIVANNSVASGGIGPDVAKGFVSAGYNLVESVGGAVILSNTTGNVTGADPVLGPLADNGGSTLTHALLSGSPALDAGDAAFSSPPATDQRGALRVQGDYIDIGAYEEKDKAEMSVSKTVSDAMPIEGQTVAYTVVASNAGPADATGVAVTDLLPDGVTHVSDDSGGSYVSDSGLWSIGSLAAGSAETLNLQVTIDSGTVLGLITNTATLSATDQTDFDANNNTGRVVLEVLPLSDLTVAVRPSHDPVVIGDVFTFTISVTNLGPDTAEQVAVTNPIPAGTEYVAVSSSQGLCSYVGGVVMCELGALPVDATVTLDLRAIGTGTVSNEASVGGRVHDPAPANNMGEGDTTVIAPGQLRFSSASYAKSETAPHAIITVLRTNGTDGAVSVDYSTEDNGATAGADYTASSGTLVFAEGVTSGSFLVGLSDDFDDEPDEAVALRLLNPGGYGRLGGEWNATLTITDDDEAGALSFTEVYHSVSEGAGQAILQVIRTGGGAGVVSVDYEVWDGQATNGLDYTADTGTLVFVQGEFNKSIQVTIHEDGLAEGNEEFIVALTTVDGGAVLGDYPLAEMTIIDNELRLRLSASTYTVGEGGGSNTVTVLREGDPNSSVSVDYQTTSGTATEVLDYGAASGTLTFGPGQMERSFVIPIVDDAIPDEGAGLVETVGVELSSPTGGAALGSPHAGSMRIVDNDRTVLYETFDKRSLPSGWRPEPKGVSHGSWRFDDPGRLGNLTGGSGGFAVIDSDWVYSRGRGKVDARLFTPPLDLSGFSSVQLSFEGYFNRYNCRLTGIFGCRTSYDEVGDVEISANGLAGSWQLLWRFETDTRVKSVADISSIAAGEADVRIRFRYHNSQNDRYWMLDNVKVVGTAAPASSPALIQFDRSHYAVVESDPEAVVTLIRSGNPGGAVYVTCESADGSAEAGPDYTSITTSVRIPDGGANASVPLPILNDLLDEPNETVLLSLLDPSGAGLGPLSTATLTIIDDEGELADLSVTKSDAVDPVKLGTDITYTIAVSNAGPYTATATEVIDTLPANMTFVSAHSAAGSCTEAGGIVTCDLGGLPAHRSAVVTVVGRPLAAGTFENHVQVSSDAFDPDLTNNSTQETTFVESAGTFAFAAAVRSVGEGVGTIELEVLRHGGSEGAVSVDYTTSDGTAIATADYGAVSGTLYLPHGVVSTSVTVSVVNDALLEGSQYFYVDLSHPTGEALLGLPVTVAVNIVDDESLSELAGEGFGDGGGAGPSTLDVASIQTGSVPAGWTVFDHAGSGIEWSFTDPGGRGNLTGGSGAFAIADSLHAGAVAVDTELRSPSYNLTNTHSVVLGFKSDFLQGSNGVGVVAVSTNGSSGPWLLVWATKGSDRRGPATETVDITAVAAGMADVTLLFRYLNATNGGWWQIDDVSLVGEEDSDGDGLPDWWELLHFSGETNAVPSGDDDFDGALNVYEFEADTDPGESNSVPAILHFSGDGSPTVWFEGSPLRLYDLLWRPSLSTGDWQEIDVGVPGMGALQSISDANPAPSAFYRLRIRRD